MWLQLFQTLNSNRDKKRTVRQIPSDYHVKACINYLNRTLGQRQLLTPMNYKTYYGKLHQDIENTFFSTDTFLFKVARPRKRSLCNFLVNQQPRRAAQASGSRPILTSSGHFVSLLLGHV